MKSKDKTRIYIFKSGQDNFEIRFLIPNKTPMEWSVKGSFMEVEDSLLSKAKSVLNDNDFLNFARDIGISDKFFIINDKPATDVVTCISKDFRDDVCPDLTWCGHDRPNSFKFISLDQAVEHRRHGGGLIVCISCIDGIRDYIKS